MPKPHLEAAPVLPFEPYRTKKQLADHLAVSERWIELRVKHDNLPARKVGRAVRFRLSEVERWLEEQQ